MTSILSPASKTSRRKADSTFDNICLKFAGPRKSSSLPVSKKFYADILERVIVTSLPVSYTHLTLPTTERV